MVEYKDDLPREINDIQRNVITIGEGVIHLKKKNIELDNETNDLTNSLANTIENFKDKEKQWVGECKDVNVIMGKIISYIKNEIRVDELQNIMYPVIEYDQAKTVPLRHFDWEADDDWVWE
jgi:hypothetical protein